MKHILSFESNKIIYLAGMKKGNSLSISKEEHIVFSAEDEDSRKEALLTLVKNNSLTTKKVDIVLPSKGFLLRELYLPSAKNKRQQRELVLNEMLYYHTNLDEYAVDYLPTGLINEEGQKGFVACAINKNTLTGLLQLLEEADVKPSSVDIAPDCVAKLLSFAGYSGKTIIFVEINNDYTELYILDKGCPVFTRRLNFKHASFSGNAQILSEELAEHINRLLQFQRTRHVNETLSEVIIGGNAPSLEELPALIQEELEAMRPSEIHCSLLSLSDLLKGEGDCDIFDLKASGALLKGEMNFLGGSGDGKKKSIASYRSKNQALLFLGAYALLLIVFPLLAGKVTEHIFRSKAESIMVFNTSTDEAIEYQRLLSVQQEYTALKSENDSLEIKEDLIKELPQMTNKMYQALTAPMSDGMNITDITYSTHAGALSVTLTGPTGASATSYVENLRKSGYFSSVSYTGWTLNQTCYFIINCTVKGADLA